MPDYKVSVILAAGSGLPRDAVQNTMYYAFSTVPSSGQFDALGGVIRDFYTQFISGGTNRVKDYLADHLDHSSNAAKCLFYLMPGSPGPTGTPVHQFNWTLTAATSVGANLPDQVAVVNSFHGSLVGVINAARHRGRFYLGPLSTNALQLLSGTGAPNTVSATMATDVTKASQQYLSVAAAAVGWDWRVWSQADWTPHSVVGGYVDDRFDTQRRRLERTTGRTTW